MAPKKSKQKGGDPEFNELKNLLRQCVCSDPKKQGEARLAGVNVEELCYIHAGYDKDALQQTAIVQDQDLPRNVGQLIPPPTPIDICDFEAINGAIDALQDPVYRPALEREKQKLTALIRMIQSGNFDNALFCSKFVIMYGGEDICPKIKTLAELEQYYQCKSSKLVNLIKEDLLHIGKLLNGDRLTKNDRQKICKKVSYCVESLNPIQTEQGVAEQAKYVTERTTEEQQQVGGKKRKVRRT